MIFTSSCCDNLSIDEIIERAEKGDCEAQYIVGFYYNRDSAIDSPDDEKAFYWLKLAAEQGHCEAQYSLGQKYTEDKSRHKDNEHAIFWLKKAALQGHTFASNALGWILDRGEDPNYKEAVVWYQIAAESGMSYAQNNLGWMYRNGNGVAKDYALAFFWYKQAALQGHSDAQNNLADLYEDGKGVAQNETLAAFWYLKSAQQGNRHAQFQIAWDYNAGEGVDQDYKQAMYWYLKAAAQGASALTSTSVICINTDKALRKIIRLPLNGLRKPLNAMTPLPGITWPLCITTEKEDLSISDRLSTCIVKFSHPEPEMSVKKFVRLKIYCRDKNKGRGISFGPYSLYCCAKSDYYGSNGRLWNWS